MHVYRQVTGVRAFRNLVVTRRRENSARFPHDDLIILKKSRLRVLHRIWHRITGNRVPVCARERLQLSRIVRREAVGLVHIYFGTEAARLLSWLPFAGVPLVVSFHGADVSNAISSFELDRVCGFAKLVLHRSESLKEALLSRGVPASKLRANPTGIPIPQECPLPSFSPGQPLRLLQACRFIEKKGIDVSLKAIQILLHRGMDVLLTLAGDGPLRPRLEQEANQLGIASRVRWTGFLTSEQLAEEYRNHAVFLHPSRETRSGDREGIPNSLLEAMAYARVVIATRHSGIPEAVVDGVNGFLVDHADPTLLADAILGIVSNTSQAAWLASAARQTVLDRFSAEAGISQLENCYREAMSNG